jgi:hypothetical protein
MFRRPFPLPTRRDGQLDVWANVCVRLHTPLLSTNGADEPPVVGYFRNLGIRLNGPQPKNFLERIIDDGAIDWSDTTVAEVDPQSLDGVVREKVTAPDDSGVWYRSGRMFFPEDDAAA